MGMSPQFCEFVYHDYCARKRHNRRRGGLERHLLELDIFFVFGLTTVPVRPLASGKLFETFGLPMEGRQPTQQN
jgi:hypothetical protein